MQLFGQDLSSAKWRASIIISLRLLAAMLWMPSGMLLEIFAARARSGSRLARCLAGPGGHFQQRGFPASQSPAWNTTRGSSSQTQALHFSLICFIMLSLAHSSSLYKLLWMASLPLSVSTHTSSSTRFQYLLEARALWFLPVTSANQLVLAPAAETFLNVNSLPPRHSSEHQLVRYLKWDSENSET